MNTTYWWSWTHEINTQTEKRWMKKSQLGWEINKHCWQMVWCMLVRKTWIIRIVVWVLCMWIVSLFSNLLHFCECFPCCALHLLQNLQNNAWLYILYEHNTFCCFLTTSICNSEMIFLKICRILNSVFISSVDQKIQVEIRNSLEFFDVGIFDINFIYR